MSSPKKVCKNRPEEEINFDHEQQEALELVDKWQNEIDILTEKASEEILKIEQKYNTLRKPFYDLRNEVVQKVERFWITAFANHPAITAILDEAEEDCLLHLTKLEVEDFDDIKYGYKIKLFFEPNEYFHNEVLVKEIHLAPQQPCCQSTPILWKEGKNIIQHIKERNETNQKQGKKRKPESKTFFTWFEDTCDPIEDEIAEVIKDDLWTNPLQYYLSPDIEVDANGVEDDAGDGEGASDEGNDSAVVVGLDDEEEEVDATVEDNDEGAPVPELKSEASASSISVTRKRPLEEDDK